MTNNHLLRRTGAWLLALTLIVTLALPAAAVGEDLTLNKSTLPLNVGQSETLTAKIGENVASPDWTSSDAEVATVTGGEVTGVKAGSATITHQGTVKTAACTVTVTEAPETPGEVESVTVSPSVDTLEVGDRSPLLAVTDPAGADVTWNSSDEAVATVDQTGVVVAQDPGKTQIKASASEEVFGTSEITVSGIRLTTDTVELTSGESAALLEGQYGDAAISLAGSINWTSDSPSVASVSAQGEVKAGKPGSATIEARVGSYSAICKVTVQENTTAGLIEETLDAGQGLDFSDLLGKLAEVIDQRLDYLSDLSVRTDQGILYYGYASPDNPGQGVGSTERYYYRDGVNGQRSLSDVTFIPKAGFVGKATIHYTGYATDGTSFSGKIEVEVDGAADVAYTTSNEEPVQFQTSDFSAVCRARNGRDLSYVTFDLPSASKGTLYYGYTGPEMYNETVKSGTKYNRSRNPMLDNITFVPAEGYSGTVLIDYRCTDTLGSFYDGQVTITVTGTGSGGVGDVSYTTGRDGTVKFQGSDFNSACRDSNDESLHDLKFQLPSSSEGSLYYNYRSSGSYDSRVSASTWYYYGGSPSISNITFVAKDGYEGTVSIPFSGYDDEGDPFSGTVTIDVGKGEAARTVRYSAADGGEVRFDSSDFNDVCWDATGERWIMYDLNFLQQEGVLYYKYGKSGSNKVTASTSYYRGSGGRALDEVSFVPAKKTSGTVTFRFDGWSTGGERFNGTVEIEAAAAALPVIRYAGSSAPIRLRGEDFQGACLTALGQELATVQFTSLSGQSTGRLYKDYVSPSQKGSTVTTGSNYGPQGLDQMSFVPKAGFQGWATLTYTGTDTKGAQFDGCVEIAVADMYCADRFADMGQYGWAKPSVEFLYQSGVTKGITDTRFAPSQNIRRGDFVLMLCRAFQLRTDSTSNFSDVPANSHYGWAIATAKDLGIAKGNNGKFLPNSAITRQEAMVMIKRTMLAAGQYLPDGSASVLTGYADGAQVSAYAKDAVATLVQLGVVRGNSANKLNPRAPISRAEMAVILHRVLTL